MWTIEQARNDVRVVFRSLRKTPVYAATAVATLAIGMGTAAAAFCITYNIAYRPLPYADADRLVRVYESNPAANELKHDVSQATFYEWSSALKSVDGIALIGRPATRFVPGDPPTPVIVSAVSPSFFHLLGVAPIHGEVFKSDAHYTPPAREIVISYATAKRYFNDERNAVGRTLQLGERDQPIRIIGVMPPSFTFGDGVDVWRLQLVRAPIPPVVRGWRNDDVIARLRPDYTLSDLRAELAVVSDRLASDYPKTNGGWQATAVPLRHAVAGRLIEAGGLFTTAVIGLLLVACVNVSGLLASRALHRRFEIATRLTLGANQWQLGRLWLIEALIIVALGTTMALTLAWSSVVAFRALAPAGFPRMNELSFDLAPFLLLSLAFVVTTVICTIAPAFYLSRMRTPSLIRNERDYLPPRAWLSKLLVTIQCATALILVALTFVFAASFIRLTQVDLGWNSNNLVAMNLSPRMPREVGRPWFLYFQWSENLVDRLQTSPLIQHATVTTSIPFTSDMLPADVAPGAPGAAGISRRPGTLHIVTSSYFATVGIRLVEGRLFEAGDKFDASVLAGEAPWGPGVAIITESVARTLWPNEQAVGKTLHMPGLDRCPFREVVGVVNDVQYASVGRTSDLHVFVPWGQGQSGVPRLLVRTEGNPSDALPTIRSLILQENSGTGIDRVTLLEDVVDESLAPVRLPGELLASVSVVVLFLAAIGTYGALALYVNAHRSAFALRVALGASQIQTIRTAMRRGLAPVTVGVIIGLALAAASITSVRHLVVVTNGFGAAAIIASGVVVFSVGVVAAMFPALRASRTDPTVILRGD